MFIVHGHDGEAREATDRFLGKIGCEPIVLHDQPNGGLTIIEKLFSHAEAAAYAVVLLTPDDLGRPVGTAEDKLKFRARQNVLVELGFFVGLLGRKHVCALVKGDVEIPSDFAGVVYIKMDPANRWKIDLAREMHNAGLPIDFSRAANA